MPDKGGGIPFINSNPAVPLPTGEVDSATIRPFPTSAHGGRQVYMHFATLSLSYGQPFLHVPGLCDCDRGVIVTSYKMSISHRLTAAQVNKL